jgi:hypothetical protein
MADKVYQISPSILYLTHPFVIGLRHGTTTMEKRSQVVEGRYDLGRRYLALHESMYCC